MVGGDFNFDLDNLMRVLPSVAAALLLRRLVDSDQEQAAASGRTPLCSFQGPEGTRMTRIDGLLVDTRLATLLCGAELLLRGAKKGTRALIGFRSTAGLMAGIVYGGDIQSIRTDH